MRGSGQPTDTTADDRPALRIQTVDPRLYNADLAPIEHDQRSWGWFAVFNVWSNVVQSLFMYTLAASFFVTSGLNGWAVFGAIAVAGLIIMVLVNLSGRPSIRYGVPYPVMARASMGVRGANVPAMCRGIVAVFWYGAQTYIASTAIALLLNSLLGIDDSRAATTLGLTPVGWIALVFVWSFQMVLFWNGIDAIRRYLNWAAPMIYAVMLVLMVLLWAKAGNGLFNELGSIFQGESKTGGGVAAFMAIVGTMIASYAPIILNYGDFTRYVGRESDMRLGNLLGLPISIALFAFMALFITAGTAVVFGERLTSPTEIIGRVDNLVLTVVAALTFFAATVGINLVANFVPPANDLSNLLPSRISFRLGGLVAAGVAFFVAAFWVTVISHLGIDKFVDTLGAVLAPAYGILIADYYLVKRGRLDLQQLFSTNTDGAYFYEGGWNRKALLIFVASAVLSVVAVWLPALDVLAGFDWLLGALIGGGGYWLSMRRPRL
ncbi:MAG: NCS1 family nucleobase:cation symporter-1 [Pseudomonadota bacterium]